MKVSKIIGDFDENRFDDFMCMFKIGGHLEAPLPEIKKLE